MLAQSFLACSAMCLVSTSVFLVTGGSFSAFRASSLLLLPQRGSAPPADSRSASAGSPAQLRRRRVCGGHVDLRARRRARRAPARISTNSSGSEYRQPDAYADHEVLALEQLLQPGRLGGAETRSSAWPAVARRIQGGLKRQRLHHQLVAALRRRIRSRPLPGHGWFSVFRPTAARHDPLAFGPAAFPAHIGVHQQRHRHALDRALRQTDMADRVAGLVADVLGAPRHRVAAGGRARRRAAADWKPYPARPRRSPRR